MRLIDYFPHASITIKKSAADWKQAVDFSMEPLLRNKYVSAEYVQAIKDSTLNNGPYYILAPYVAMPHARPEFGVLKTGMSLTLLKEPVEFGEKGEQITLLIGLAAADAHTHIDAIQALSELLCEAENLSDLLSANTENQLADILLRA